MISNNRTFLLQDFVNSANYQNTTAKLPIILGKTNSDNLRIADLTDLPNLLVSGATKQGKTNFLKSLISGLILRKEPQDLKLVLIDTKYTAFNEFRKLANQYLTFGPYEEVNEDICIANDTDSCTTVLKLMFIELEKRKSLLKKAGLKRIAEYNDRQNNLTKEDALPHLPYIVCVCDEYSDLTNFSGKSNKENKKYIIRLAKKGPAVGIHMVIATQRPLPEVITWRIKRHFPSRIAFRVTMKNDSKVILNRAGAEEIKAQGEMIFCNERNYERLQTPYFDEKVFL